MSTPGQAKRKRTDSASGISNTPVQSKVVWAGDGNIILEAESTQFRVHRSMLSGQSTVFADMFTVPQPQNEPTVEDCPIVHLHDTWKDVEYFLRALYDGGWYYGKQLPKLTVIAAILRMSRKYDCKHLHKDALTRLTIEYPSTLKEWDATRGTSARIRWEDTLPIDIITLAWENSFNRVLPAAFLSCIENFSLEDVLVGVTRDDGTTAMLSPELQKLCIIGSERFNVATLVHASQWIAGMKASATECSSEAICPALRGFLLCSFLSPGPHETSGGVMGRWECHSNIISKMCQKCKTAGALAHEAARETLWELLPSFLGIPEWDELKNE